MKYSNLRMKSLFFFFIEDEKFMFEDEILKPFFKLKMKNSDLRMEFLFFILNEDEKFKSRDDNLILINLIDYISYLKA